METDMAFAESYGPWAVVAGASEGVGAGFAGAVAERGLNVVLLARRQQVLDEVAARIEADHGVQVRAVAVDLAEPGAAGRVVDATSDLEVGLFMYNAGADPDYCHFLTNSAKTAVGMVHRNCVVPTELGYHFAGPMVERGRGGVILVGSAAGFAGAPNMVVYSATKSFDMVLAEGLWAELKPRGVDVLACVTGATLTPNFMDNTPKEKWSGVFPLEPSQVAAEGLANLDRGPIHIAGAMNRGVHALFSHLPRRAVVGLMTRIANGLYGDKG